MRLFYSALLFFAIVSAGLAQTPTVVADGNPPLTDEMVIKYTHFMQWTMIMPLTVAQEDRIKTYLTGIWRANDRAEIERTLNLLELRDQLESLHQNVEPWAAVTMRGNAVHNWKTGSDEMSKWGMALYNANHSPLVPGNPPLTRQMEDSYEEMGYFVLTQVYNSSPQHIDAVERADLANVLGGQFKSMPADQQANFAKLPEVWYQVRNAWPNMDDASKSALAASWKAHFSPPKAGPGKKVTDLPAGRPIPKDTFGRLATLTWMVSPADFGKMSAFGADKYAFGNGW